MYGEAIRVNMITFSFLSFQQKALEEHNKKSTEELKSLFKYAQGAAHVWDVHEIGLARQERALQEKLEQSRQLHDNQNQASVNPLRSSGIFYHKSLDWSISSSR